MKATPLSEVVREGVAFNQVCPKRLHFLPAQRRTLHPLRET